MSTYVSTVQFDHAVQYGTSEFELLIDEIKKDAVRRRNEGYKEHPFYAAKLLKESKFGALRLPVELGGGGASVRELFQALIRLAEVDPDVAHILRVHFSLVEDYLFSPESEERTKWLSLIATGAIIGNAYTELSKKHVGKLEFDTKLTKEDDHYRLNGTKYFSTGTLYADYIFITASNDDNVTVSAVIPSDREGIVIEDDWDGIGQRFTGSGTTHLNNVYVAEHEFSIMGEGKTPFNSYLQLFLQAVIAGIAHAVTADASALLHSRKRTFTFATAEVPANDPQLQQVVGTIASYAYAAEAAVLTAADALQAAIDSAVAGVISVEASHFAALQAAKAKIVVDELALKASTLLFEVGGSSATRQSAFYDRHWRNIRTIASHNPNVYKARAIGNYIVNQQSLPINEVYF